MNIYEPEALPKGHINSISVRTDLKRHFLPQNVKVAQLGVGISLFLSKNS
jgi:hypothetical protein